MHIEFDKMSEIELQLHDAGWRLSVLLDGASITHVIAADEEEGWVERRRIDASGEFYVENGEAATERLVGNVWMGWRPPAA